MKLTMEQQYILSELHDVSSQCMSRHGIDLTSRNIPSPASEKFTQCKYSAHSLFGHNLSISLYSDKSNLIAIFNLLRQQERGPNFHCILYYSDCFAEQHLSLRMMPGTYNKTPQEIYSKLYCGCQCL